MEYLYYLANTSLTLRLIEFLRGKPQIPVSFITVISQIDGWVIKIKLKSLINPQLDGDIKAFLNELGIPHSPSKRVSMALESLAAGHSPVNVMHKYQVAVVSHGSPQREDIEAFRQQFINGLGYCPPTLV
ncbi:hypothetical protein WA1_13670 [Scytonema hofmannii PCC 7110]|uniref:Uncharacterized protein n=1 Tax=Scytonema hofmannii PCC 7110 TaxID=128403 RepID=A0A139XEU4_9CYAN|nr:hypothetical protein [Scytonema hofmannii]KYC43142.1 hypothetical protein WA1_13670 [Scytonema hofmannii PCC 7110]